MTLTKSQIDQFHEDGFLNGGPCLTEEEVDVLRAEIERVISDRENLNGAQPALLRNLCEETEPKTQGEIWQIVNIWMASPYFRLLIEKHKIAEDIAQLTNADELRVWHDQIQYKPSRVGGTLMWHQDAPAWPVLSPMTEVSAWVALDDVDQSNGCMRMVPGSHRWGDQSDLLSSLSSFSALPNTFDGHKVRMVAREVMKGEVHYHHALTWHGSPANMSSRPRRAVAIHYMINGTRFVASGEHPIKNLIEVPDGALIKGENFPLCYSRRKPQLQH